MSADETVQINTESFEKWFKTEYPDLILTATQRMWLYGQLSTTHVPPPWPFGNEEGGVAHDIWRMFTTAVDADGSPLYTHPVITHPNPLDIE